MYPGVSVYAYCNNNPVKYIDPTGMGCYSTGEGENFEQKEFDVASGDNSPLIDFGDSRIWYPCETNEKDPSTQESTSGSNNQSSEKSSSNTIQPFGQWYPGMGTDAPSNQGDKAELTSDNMGAFQNDRWGTIPHWLQKFGLYGTGYGNGKTPQVPVVPNNIYKETKTIYEYNGSNKLSIPKYNNEYGPLDTMSSTTTNKTYEVQKNGTLKLVDKKEIKKIWEPRK